MTYKEASQALGVAIPSVKQRARRSRWARQAGNDGQARIDVPAELLLKAPTKPDTNAPTSLPSTPPTSSPVADLIERLETRLSEALTDRAIARAELARADRLIEELRVDRDNWHSLANRSWWRRLVG
jgi:hypothetical protein